MGKKSSRKSSNQVVRAQSSRYKNTAIKINKTDNKSEKIKSEISANYLPANTNKKSENTWVKTLYNYGYKPAKLLNTVLNAPDKVLSTAQTLAVPMTQQLIGDNAAKFVSYGMTGLRLVVSPQKTILECAGTAVAQYAAGKATNYIKDKSGLNNSSTWMADEMKDFIDITGEELAYYAGSQLGEHASNSIDEIKKTCLSSEVKRTRIIFESDGKLPEIKKHTNEKYIKGESVYLSAKYDIETKTHTLKATDSKGNDIQVRASGTAHTNENFNFLDQSPRPQKMPKHEIESPSMSVNQQKPIIHQPPSITAVTMMLDAENAARNQGLPGNHFRIANQAAHLLAKNRWGDDVSKWDMSLVMVWEGLIYNAYHKGGYSAATVAVSPILLQTQSDAHTASLITQFTNGQSLNSQSQALLFSMDQKHALSSASIEIANQAIIRLGYTGLVNEEIDQLHSQIFTILEGPTSKQEDSIVKAIVNYLQLHCPDKEKSDLIQIAYQSEHAARSFAQGEWVNTPSEYQIGDLARIHSSSTNTINKVINTVASSGVAVQVDDNGTVQGGTIDNARLFTIHDNSKVDVLFTLPANVQDSPVTFTSSTNNSNNANSHISNNNYINNHFDEETVIPMTEILSLFNQVGLPSVAVTLNSVSDKNTGKPFNPNPLAIPAFGVDVLSRVTQANDIGTHGFLPAVYNHLGLGLSLLGNYEDAKNHKSDNVWLSTAIRTATDQLIALGVKNPIAAACIGASVVYHQTVEPVSLTATKDELMSGSFADFVRRQEEQEHHESDSFMRAAGVMIDLFKNLVDVTIPESEINPLKYQSQLNKQGFFGGQACTTAQTSHHFAFKLY